MDLWGSGTITWPGRVHITCLVPLSPLLMLLSQSVASILLGFLSPRFVFISSFPFFFFFFFLTPHGKGHLEEFWLTSHCITEENISSYFMMNLSEINLRAQQGKTYTCIIIY
jgi:hypothetical protein